MAISKNRAPVESVSPLAELERRLKSRMLGNPLVRFCEGQGGNGPWCFVTCRLKSTLSTRPRASAGCHSEAEGERKRFKGFGFWDWLAGRLAKAQARMRKSAVSLSRFIQ